MANAHVLNGWLYFRELDYGHQIDRAFAIGYRLIDNPDEVWSRRLLSLKDGKLASRNAVLAVMRVAMPVLLDDLGLDGKDVTFAPAVRSSETTASQSGTLARLAQHCAALWNSEYSRQLLSKQPHSSLHWPSKNVLERKQILEEADYQAREVTTANVFVLDDLITTGLTLCYSASAIKNRNPEVKVYGLAPGKHAYRRDFQAGRRCLPNSHIPPEWDRLWKKHDSG